MLLLRRWQVEASALTPPPLYHPFARMFSNAFGALEKLKDVEKKVSIDAAKKEKKEKVPGEKTEKKKKASAAAAAAPKKAAPAAAAAPAAKKKAVAVDPNAPTGLKAAAAFNRKEEDKKAAAAAEKAAKAAAAAAAAAEAVDGEEAAEGEEAAAKPAPEKPKELLTLSEIQKARQENKFVIANKASRGVDASGAKGLQKANQELDDWKVSVKKEAPKKTAAAKKAEKAAPAAKATKAAAPKPKAEKLSLGDFAALPTPAAAPRAADRRRAPEAVL